MTAYLVRWEINIEADSPEEAAVIARQLQDDSTTATIFDVRDTKGDRVRVVDVNNLQV